MDNTLNNLIFLFYILTALSIWGTMTLRKKYLVLSLTTWLFWIIAIIGHSYALTFILNDEFKVNLSVNYALTLVAFIISVTLYISASLQRKHERSFLVPWGTIPTAVGRRHDVTYQYTGLHTYITWQHYIHNMTTWHDNKTWHDMTT